MLEKFSSKAFFLDNYTRDMNIQAHYRIHTADFVHNTPFTIILKVKFKLQFLVEKERKKKKQFDKFLRSLRAKNMYNMICIFQCLLIMHSKKLFVFRNNSF